MKNYDSWSAKKSELETRKALPEFSERDIWWCSLGLNIGYEEDGKNERFERPVCILRKFNKDIFMGLPLTSALKDSPYYFAHSLNETAGSVILSQGRLLSAKRLQRKLGRMGRGKFRELRNKYAKLF